MVDFLSCIASNVLFAACLAVFATLLTRAWRNPHLAHALWLLVLIKLVTPPVVRIPVGRLVADQSSQNAGSRSSELRRLACCLTRKSMQLAHSQVTSHFRSDK